MKEYEVSKLRRVKEYRILMDILKQHHVRHLDQRIVGEEGTVYVTIPKSESSRMEEELEKSKLVYRILKEESF